RISGAAAAVPLILIIAGMAYSLSGKRAQNEKLTQHRLQIEKELADHAQERAELDAYKDWEQSTIPWLDELYDLTARYPYKTGFRVNQFAASMTGSKKAAKEGFVGEITLN